MDYIIGITIGAIITFTSFYMGLHLGQKLNRNEKITIPKPKPHKTRIEKKKEKEFVNDIDAVLEQSVTSMQDYYDEQRKL